MNIIQCIKQKERKDQHNEKIVSKNNINCERKNKKQRNIKKTLKKSILK
jgi:hypothetical protein